VSVLAHLVVLPLLPAVPGGAVATQLAQVLAKVVLLLPIAAATYELQRWSSRPSCPRFVRWLALPGLWVQRVTAREPTDEQLEVALLALRRCIAVDEAVADEPRLEAAA
jgi:uncharacterized protein YqhQ